MAQINTNTGGFTFVEVLLLLVAFIIICGTGYLVAKHAGTKKPTASTQAMSNAFALPSGWSWYRNTAYGFMFGYPNSWGQPQVNIGTGSTGTDYYINFSPGPAYNSSNGPSVSRNQMSLDFSSDDYSVPGQNGNPPSGPQASRAAILSTIAAHKAGTLLGDNIISVTSTSYVSLTSSNAAGATDVLGYDEIISLPKLKVSGASDSYQIVDSPASCSQNGLSSDSQEWCTTHSILNELTDVLNSIRST